MRNNFQQLYIENWARIANNYDPIIKHSKYARLILAYLSVELSKQRRPIYSVALNLLP